MNTQVNFTILLAASNVDHAIKLYKQLIEKLPDANITVDSRSPQTSQSARAPLPSGVYTGGNGKHVAAICEYLSSQEMLDNGFKPVSRFMVKSRMAEMFNLTGNREQQAEKFLRMLKSGEVIRTPQGYQFSSGGGIVADDNASGESMEGIDLDDVV